MVNRETVEHIRGELILGRSESEIRKSLLETGYSLAQVDEAFVALSERVDESNDAEVLGDRSLVRKRKLPKILTGVFLGFLFLVAVVAGGIAAYEAVYLSPELVLERATEKLAEAEDYSLDMNLELGFDVVQTEDTGKDQDFAESFASGLMQLFANGEFRSTATGVVDQSGGSTKLKLSSENFLDVFVFNNIDFNYEMIVADGETYVKLNEQLPFIPFSIDTNTWFRLTSMDKGDDVPAQLSWWEYFQELDATKRSRIREAFLENQVFIFEKDKESLFQQDLTRGYKVTLNNDNFEMFKSELLETVELPVGIEEQIDQLGNLERFEIRYRVGIFDSELKTIRLDLQSKPSEFGFVYDLVITAFMSDYNQGQRVELPSNSVDLQEYLEEKFSEASASAKLSQDFDTVTESETVSVSENTSSSFEVLPTGEENSIVVNSSENQPTTNYDVQRQADLATIADAVIAFTLDNNNVFPESIPTGEPTEIGTNQNLVDLEADLVPTYLDSMPFDPVKGSRASTHYKIYFTDQGRIFIEALADDGTTVLRVVR